MIKFYKDPKSQRLYVDDQSFAGDEQFNYEKYGLNNEIVFRLYQVNGGQQPFANLPYTAFEKRDGSPYTDLEEFETFLADEVVGKDLRVYRLIPRNSDVKHTDFSLLDLSKESPHYDRGRKVKAQYLDYVDNALVVEKVFTDIRHNDGRLDKIQIDISWYTESGEVGLTRTTYSKKFSKAAAETEERERRERAIDFLMSEARGTPNEPYVQTLFAHYGAEIADFKSQGTSDFATGINTETDPNILAILSARVPFTSDPNFTVPIKESILYQIGALGEPGLLATLQPVGS